MAQAMKSVNIRIPPDLHRKYFNTCRTLGIKVSDLHRTMVEAVVEGRLTILPKKDQSVTIKGIHKS